MIDDALENAAEPLTVRPTELVPLNQRCNQTQEFLLLWSAAGRNEKGSDLNVGHLPARRKIGFVPHEHPAAIGIDGEQPPIAVGTDVNGSGPNGHEGSLQRTILATP